MWKRRDVYRVLVRKREERRPLERPRVDRIILKRILDKWN
jgi:hypothetical protein